MSEIDAAIARVMKARERLIDADLAVYGTPAQHKVVTQAHLDEISAAKAELEAAELARDQALGKRA